MRVDHELGTGDKDEYVYQYMRVDHELGTEDKDEHGPGYKSCS